MRYMQSRYEQEKRDRMYRIYVTDALKILGNLNMRYYDLIEHPVSETRTPEEIISNISKKLEEVGKTINGG